MEFIPHGHTAFDESTGITISHPKMYPEKHADGTITAEDEYTLFSNDEIIDGIVISGDQKTTEKNGSRQYTYTLEIVEKNTFERLLRLKEMLRNESSEYEFISKIAQGLVNVFINTKGNSFAQRNLVTTTNEALSQNGVIIPNYAHTLPDGTIILAESYIPANSEQNSQP